jgi:hypothetical protein
MPPTVSSPASTRCAPSHVMAAVPSAVESPMKILKRYWTSAAASVARRIASVLERSSRLACSSRPNACTTGMNDSVRSTTSYCRPSASCCA